jgi:four helix bundle protein
MKSNLEDRLVDFSSLIIVIGENLKEGYTSTQLSRQIIRSGISSSLNYGEAQHAESRKDFFHKCSIVLKELRETMVNLKLIRNSGLMNDIDLVEKALVENDELVAIFTKIILTTRRNLESEQPS